jgi:pimeloyl-ACP methyl ester carboxylesterase
MTRIVLVHGAFSGAWTWEPVIPALEAAGHSVTAIDLPGSGEDQTPADEVTLDGYATRVTEALDSDDEPAVLVGHSMGGVVITHAAGMAPDRIRKLVYVCAFLPPDGKGLLDMTQLPEGADDQIQANLIIEPPVGRLTEEGIRKAAYNNTPEDAILAALPRRRPQPLAPMGMPVARGPGFDSIPRAYVVCTRDQSIPPPLQRRMIADDGHVSEVFELDTDHAPMLSATDELVGILDRVAASA